MLPVIKGVEATLRQIVIYSFILVAASFLYTIDSGQWLYTTAAAILGAVFIYKAMLARKKKDDKSIWSVFKFSIVYLFGLFCAMVVDNIILG